MDDQDKSTAPLVEDAASSDFYVKTEPTTAADVLAAVETDTLESQDDAAQVSSVEKGLVSANVTTIRRGTKTWHLIGTAHVSRESVDEVRAVIEKVQPDTVAIELCEARWVSTQDENRWEKLNIFEVIKEKKTLMLLANLALGAYQKRMGEELGVKPGAEMLEAAKVADEMGKDVYLADRDIQITLKRTWQNIGFMKRVGLLGGLMDAIFSGGEEKMSAEDIEDLKASTHDMLDELATEFPEVKGPLIDERDLYMVSKLREAPGDIVVAVVGAGHVPGMTAHWDDPIDRDALTTIKPPSRWVSALKWGIPLLVLLAFGWGFRQHGGESLQSMITAWVLPNVLFAALFTLLAGAKLPTVIVAGICSPITSMNPLINVGIPTGFCEAWLRKPTVADAQSISDDIQTVKGFYRNAFTRTLIVTIASIIGSAMGAWVGIGWIGTILGTS